MADWGNWAIERNNGIDCATWIAGWNNGISRELNKEDITALGLRSPKDLFAIYSRAHAESMFPEAIFGGHNVWPVRTAIGRAVLVNGDLGITLNYNHDLQPKHISDQSASLLKTNEPDQLAMLWNSGELSFGRGNTILGMNGEKFFSTLHNQANQIPNYQWNQDVITFNQIPIETRAKFECDFSMEAEKEIFLIEAKSPTQGLQTDVAALQIVFPNLYASMVMDLKQKPKSIRSIVIVFSQVPNSSAVNADVFELSNTSGEFELMGWESEHTHRFVIN